MSMDATIVGYCRACGKPLDANTQAFLNELRLTFGMKVSLRGGPRRGVLEIYYTNRDEIENLMRILRQRRPL